ncbi:MAG: hybrid sensory histidine kinase BarA [Methanosaeta sp. PtaB.Bin039]|nr:MAG: hybrid sensory histidine kinase BarA [Methanosaeta sp. PtaB.Bin039]OPY45067.1 MAG: hybrid sensory histidine kinase BarA [Methanosaeta sp. PtaU1.Bin028]HOT06668.1 response regulator [Methanotrichaceae archaeon]HQF16696.1 response regulator [Methanotrichaceae archaeon]HQI91292.1 response regulator [Methanotrichaceae archaeon]
MSVMLVEDNPEDVFFTKRVLKQSGIEQITVVGDGQAALVTLEEMAADGRLPNLVLLDINLPVMGGIALLKRLKKNPRLSGIPVVMLTGSNVDCDIQTSYDLGASSYLVKPISKEALQLVLASVFP